MQRHSAEDPRPPNVDRVALDNCDREPIRVPATIQPFGCLIATDLQLSEVRFASANVESFLPVGAREVLAISPTDLLGRERVHTVRNLLSRSASRSRRLAAGTIDGAEVPLAIYVHQAPGGQAVLEFEPADRDGVQADDAVEILRRLFDRGVARLSLDALLTAGVERLRRLTNYDRVLAYQLEESGDGQVVAESIRAPKVGSFLGLRFPAWDIPKQARELMLDHPIRVLSDIDQEPVALLARGGEPDQLDLSYAHLRGVSAVHAEYLRNMGVRGTMTISLRVRDRLWGMLSCHHLAAYAPSASIRSACDLFGQVTSMAIEVREQLTLTERRVGVERVRSELADQLSESEGLEACAPQLLETIDGVFESDGLAFVREGRVVSSGTTPPASAVATLVEQLRSRAGGEVLAIESFKREATGLDGLALEPSAGCLLLAGDGGELGTVVFFRNAKAHNVRWAGRPEKSIDVGPDGPRLSPRGSFDLFVEHNHGQCDRWTEVDVAAARELRAGLVHLGAQVQARATEARLTTVHRRRQDVLIAELNHRVKNILSVVRSVARRAGANAGSVEEFVAGLDERIASIAASHDAAFRSSGQNVALRRVLELPFGHSGGVDTSAVSLDGPRIGLRSDVALALGLVTHELATNAAKYGALSTPGGSIAIRWSFDRGVLRLDWREQGGPPVVESSARGFGYTLITQSIPYEFGGQVDYRLEPDGLQFTLELPPGLAHEDVALEAAAASDDSPAVAEPTPEAVVEVGSVLIVEDNLVLAMDLRETLQSVGIDSVEIASSVAVAEEILQSTEVDAAILDMRLNAGTTLDFARQLARDGVPFLFATGYGSGLELPEDLAGVTVLTKPVAIAAVAAELRRLVT